MRPNEILFLHEYSWWTTDLLLNKASEITAEQFAAPNALPWGSIRGTFQHIVSAQWVWRQRMALGVSPTALRPFDEFETVDALRSAVAEESSAWREYFAALTQDALDASVSWKNTRGNEATAPLWQALSHVVNHSTQHNAEIAQELTVIGYSPGGIDMIYYVIQQKR